MRLNNVLFCCVLILADFALHLNIYFFIIPLRLICHIDFLHGLWCPGDAQSITNWSRCIVLHGNVKWSICHVLRSTNIADRVGTQTLGEKHVKHHSTFSRHFTSMKKLVNITWKLYVILTALLDFFVFKRTFAYDVYRFKSSNFPNIRYYCPTDGLHTLKIDPRHCILYCLQMQECVALNFNRTDGLCVLLPTPCAVAYRMEGMEYTMMTGRNHEQCLKWVPFTGSNPSSDRVVNSPDGYVACRLQINNGIFIGHCGIQYEICWATDGNIQHDSGSNPCEILTIAPDCTIGWVNYTAGTPLPPTAMVAGRSYAGENLYVAMLMFPSPLPIVTGYYNVGSSRGYATENTNTHTFVVMDLMILL